MRVLLIGDRLEPTSGSARKVVTVAEEWERRGHSVWLATARHPTPRRVSDVLASFRRPTPSRSLAERIAGEAHVRLLYPARLGAACARLGIDLIYSRGLPFAPNLRGLIRDVPFVLEINGDIAREIRNPVQHRLRVHARALQLARADGVVFVSRELKRACAPAPRRSLVLANPCLPTEAEPGAFSRPERPTLALIGYAKHDWSGIDKMPALAAALPEFDFVVIGTVLSGPPNLRSYPVLTQAEADRLMSGCTVGIGPLALHRKGMYEASPLKSRNYLALGLPIIQAYEDTDVGEADGCVLQLPNTEDNVASNIERIRAFALRAYHEPQMSARALALARGRLSLQAKEDERLRFVQECLAARTAGAARSAE